MPLPDEIVEQMVCSLRNLEVDLGDERDVVEKLLSLGFLAIEIELGLDAVIEQTRGRGLKRTWA